MVRSGQSPEEEHEDGKKGGKKTSEKRKAQNRAAQRNFRERKEKHLKDLEDKVGALEQKANDSQAENSALKQLLQQYAFTLLSPPLLPLHPFAFLHFGTFLRGRLTESWRPFV